MNFFENKRLITHRSCLDGSTCAILFLHLGGKRENIYFTNPEHEAVDATVKEACDDFDGELLIADVSVSLECAEWLNKRKNVLLLDHHKSAIPLSKYSWCDIEKENKRCGSRMMFELFIHNFSSDDLCFDMNFLTIYVDDYDRWQKKYPESEKYTQLMNFLGQNIFIDRFYKNPNVQLTDNEKYVLDIISTKNKETIKRKIEEAVVVGKMIDGKLCRVAFGTEDALRSELGNAFIEELGADLAVIANANRVSFRSSKKSGIDCSRFAKMFSNNAGGHQNAGGCSIKDFLNKSLIQAINDRIDEIFNKVL